MHSTPLTSTQVPDGTDIPDIPSHLDSIVRALESYGIPRFATPDQRNANWPAPPNGALAYTGSDNRISMAHTGAWGPFVPGFIEVGGVLRDPYCAWGLQARSVASLIDTDIMPPITDHMTYHLVSGLGFGPISASTLLNRQYKVEVELRLDGGDLTADGTAMVQIVRTAPTSVILVDAIQAVPSLSVSGGGASNVINLSAFDSPGVGTASYEVRVAKRIPVTSAEEIRCRPPAMLALFDVGPIVI